MAFQIVTVIISIIKTNFLVSGQIECAVVITNYFSKHYNDRNRFQFC